MSHEGFDVYDYYLDKKIFALKNEREFLNPAETKLRTFSTNGESFQIDLKDLKANDGKGLKIKLEIKRYADRANKVLKTGNLWEVNSDEGTSFKVDGLEAGDYVLVISGLERKNRGYFSISKK